MRRTWAIAIVVLLLAATLGALAVGAVEERSPAPIEMPTSTSGALQHRAAADARAAQWQEDARLLHVSATEGRPVHNMVDPPMLWDTSADTFVGDGRALVWTFTYASAEAPQTLFWVTVGADGRELYARDLPQPWYCCFAEPMVVESTAAADGGQVAYSEPPQHAWALPPAVEATVDAPEALSAVRDRPEFADFALDHPVFMAIVVLERVGDRSVWTIGYQTATVFSSFAQVDAMTGEVVQVHAWPRPCCDPQPPEPPTPQPPDPCCRPEDFQATYEGTLGYGRASWDASFPVEQASWVDAIHVKADIDGTVLDPEAVILDVYDSDWRIVGRSTFAEGFAVTIEKVARSGIYTAMVTDRQGILPETKPVTLDVVVDYLEAPEGLAGTYTYYGEAYNMWTMGVPTWAEDDVRASDALLRFETTLPTQHLSLVLIDEWGNEIETATAGGSMGYHEVGLTLPDDGTYYWLEVRRSDEVPVFLVNDIVVYELDLTFVERVHEEHDHVAHEPHAHAESHDH